MKNYQSFEYLHTKTEGNLKKILQFYLKKFCWKFRKNLKKFKLNLLKIVRKFCECLKINAKFREGCAIFGKLYMSNVYVKYYETFIQKLTEKHKKILPFPIGHMLPRVISFTSSPFGVSSFFRHMQRTLCPNPQILQNIQKFRKFFW